MSDPKNRYYKFYKYNKDEDAKEYGDNLKDICQELHLNILHRKEKPMFMDVYEVECTPEEYNKIMLGLAEKELLK